MIPKVTILEGDCIESLRTLGDESVQCCVTSPPYWGLRDYGMAGQIGLESAPKLYVAKMVQVFAEVWRVLRSDGTLWLNLGDCYATGAGKVGNHPGGGEQGARWTGDVDRIRDAKRGYRGDQLAEDRVKTRATRDGTHAGKHTAITAMGPMTQPNRMPIEGLKPKDLIGIPWRVAFALQEAGWYLRQDIIWHKPNPMPESVMDRCTKAHEYIFLLTKSERYFYDAEAVKEPASDTGRLNGRDGRKEEDGARPPGSNPRTLKRLDYTITGRNKRSVWTVATAPYSEAHFATFPPDLIKPCIMAGTSARGCCANCGAPYERETVSGEPVSVDGTKATYRPTKGTDDPKIKGRSDGWTPNHVKPRSTIGWLPSCKCEAAIANCVVLDPFGGSGTTGMVACELGRNAILIELNPEYVKLAHQRTNVTAGLALT